MKRLKKNKAKCLRCQEEIESKHRHDFVTCACGNLAVDGGLAYARRVFETKDGWEDRCEYTED